MFFNQNHQLYPKLFQLFQTADEFLYRKRATIYTKDSIASRVFLIKKGAVKIYDYHDGYRRTKAIWYQNDFFGFDGVLGRDRHIEYAEAMTDNLELQSIEISEFENRLKEEYGICKEFLTA